MKIKKVQSISLLSCIFSILSLPLMIYMLIYFNKAIHATAIGHPPFEEFFGSLLISGSLFLFCFITEMIARIGAILSVSKTPHYSKFKKTCFIICILIFGSIFILLTYFWIFISIQDSEMIDSL